MIRHFVSGRPGVAVVAAATVAATLALGPGAPGAQGAGVPGSPGAASRSAAAPEPDGAGRWSVVATGPSSWQVRWRAPRRLPVTSDRPTVVADGQPVGVPVVTPDGRTVVTTVRAEARPRPADLDVLLSGDRLDEPGTDAPGTGATDAAPRPAPRRPAARLAADPATPGPFDVVSSDYSLDPVRVPRMPEPVEMVGHVVEPEPGAATGPRPLVLFLHGRHSWCYSPDDGPGNDWSWPCRPPMAEIPNHLGYDYLQRALASHGFTTVSVRVNGINAQDWTHPDGGAGARALVVQRHLAHWTRIADEHGVDLSRVVLVGHSRGGEGVNRAALRTRLTAPYRIAGQVLLAPTNFGTQTAPYVPTATVLPYCDGDVFDLQGQRFTDSARDLAPDDTSLKSSVLVLGANHNFFNTEWTPGEAQAPAWDDWWGGGALSVCGPDSPRRLSAQEQRAVGLAYVVGAARLFAQGADEFLPLLDGSPVLPTSVGAAEVATHALGGGRVLRRPALDSAPRSEPDVDAWFCRGVLDLGSEGACGRTGDLWGQAPHWYWAGEFAPSRRELELAWTAAGGSGGLVLDRPLDLSGASRLELRTIVDPDLGAVRVRVRLTDDAGGSATVTPEGDGLVRPLPVDRYVARRWAQAVLVDPSGVEGVDLSAIRRVDLVGDSADGRLWLLDVSAVPAAPVPPPAQRMPTVALDTLRVVEGDGTTPVTARVPFTVRGTLTRRATLVVGVADPMSERRERLRIDLAPGQTGGSVPVTYRPNDVDDFAVRTTYLSAHPVRGVMTDQYLGAMRLVDDDPAPRVTVRTPRRVREGDRVTAGVTLATPVGYDRYYSMFVVRGTGPGTRLTVGDVPARWLERHYVDVDGGLPASTPLHRAGLYLWTRIRRGQTTGTMSIPVRADALREGRERVTLRVRGPGAGTDRTVRVLDGG